ncbi:MAG: hypothetical protein KBF99_07310 [Leptospiraceae bacterium]|nr:hypothetical protein [Leptospiraceae bacterium]MBK9502166.1 hypothetical protein [Leptospiraceae bacterium]MBP9162974.1 hypothetical protein [Leptospiraceae bacterium]
MKNKTTKRVISLFLSTLSIGMLFGIVSCQQLGLEKEKDNSSTMAIALLAAGSASSGSSAGTGTAGTTVAPSGLTYSGSPYSYKVGTAITTQTPTVTGSITSCSASPTLPAGLSIATTTCAVSGTPTIESAAKDYTITATNSIGSTTAKINITVLNAYTETLFAGSTSGNIDGTGSSAKFNTTRGMAFDASGNLYVGDRFNYSIRKISTAGVVTTFAGGLAGNLDGTGTAARLNYASGLVFDSSGNLYAADAMNGNIRKITSAGVVTIFAGSNAGPTAGTLGYLDGTGTGALFGGLYGITIDSSGNLYVAELGCIRKVTPAAVVTTVAGSCTLSGNTDGTGTAARFHNIEDITIDSNGNLYVTDSFYHTIRKITSAGVVTTIAGGSLNPGADGTGTAANFGNPRGIKIGSDGNLYVADDGSQRDIRKVTTDGVVTSLKLPWKVCYSASHLAFDSVGTMYLSCGYSIVKVTK